jgi:hypothetical protein
MDDNDDDDYPNMTLHYEPRWKSTVILFLKFSSQTLFLFNYILLCSYSWSIYQELLSRDKIEKERTKI